MVNMEEYLSIYYSDIKEALTEEDIDEIKKTTHYNSYCVNSEIDKIKDVLLERIKRFANNFRK